MGDSFHYRYRFNTAGGQSFAEGSPTAVDFGDINLSAQQYGTVFIPPNPPPAPPPATSITSITIAVQNATGSDHLSLDFNALGAAGFNVNFNPDFVSGSFFRWATTSEGIPFPQTYAFFSGGVNGQPLVITLAAAATQETIAPTMNVPIVGTPLTLLDQFLDHILFWTDSIAPGPSKVIQYTFGGTYGFAQPTVTLAINQINSPPVLTLPAIAPALPTIGEYQTNAFQVSSLLPAFTDPDGPSAGIAVREAAAGNGHWEYRLNGSTDWLTIGSVSQSHALLLGPNDWVRFVGDGSLGNGLTATNSLKYGVWDGFTGTAGQIAQQAAIQDPPEPGDFSAFGLGSVIATLTITGVNDAPFLISAIPALSTITEDQVGNAGQTVASFRGTINDIDTGALKGIAITGETTGNGHWEYKLDGSPTWVSFGTVSAGSALLLRDQDLIRFVPNAENGTSASLTYAAWDRTSGAAGGRADLTAAGATGGATAFSTGTHTASITVISVNDAPTTTNLTQSLTIDEDTPTGPLGIQVTDVDANETITATLKVDNPAAGSLSTTGGGSYDAQSGIWTINGSVAIVNAALAAVTFIPAPNSTVATTIAAQIRDAAGAGPDGTISIAVTADNDAPTVTGATQTHAYTEGAASVALDPITVADSDTSDTVTVTLTLANPAAGALSGGGGVFAAGVWSFTGTVAQTNAALAALSFTPATENDVNTTIAVRVRDAAGTGPALDSTITLNVTPVEDIATITTTDVVNTEAKLPSLALFSIASKVTIVDRDTDDAATPMKYLAGSGHISDISGPLPPDEALADLLTLDADTGQVIYDRSAFRWLADGESVVYTIAFMARSGDDPAQQKSITVTINGLNDAPVLATPNHAAFAATTEDSPPGAARTVGSFRGSVTDGDPSPLFGIAITATIGNGAWQYSTDGGATWTSFTACDTSALLLRDTDLLRFAPDQENGGAASFTYRAWDQTSGAAGGFADTSTNGSATAFSRQADVVTLAVTSINDAPVMTADHMTLLSITEDETASSGQPVWTFLCMAISDVDAGAVQGIALTGLTSGNGHWEYSLDGGTTWVAVGEVGAASALLLRHDDWMRFVPDEKNATQATLTYHAWDQTTDAAGNRVDLTTAGATGGTTAYSTATDTVSIDVTAVNDAPQVSGPVTLAPFDEDTVRVIAKADLLGHTSDVDTGDTLSITELALVGSGSLVDNLDDTWTYTPDADDDSSVSFTYKVGDGIATAIATSATLDITPVNDAPVAQDGAASGDEDTTISATLVANDVDNPSLGFTLETQAAHGIVTVHLDGSYQYVPNDNYFGTDSFTFRASDGVLSSVATVSLTIDSINDPPVVSGPVTLLALKEDTVHTITRTELLANSTDVDGPLSISDLVLAGNGDLVDNLDGTWTYTPAGDDDTSVSLAYKVGDGIAATIATSATFDITPVNDTPLSQNDVAGGNEDTTIDGALTATDVDSQTLIFSMATQAQHGIVTINPNGTYSYKPNADYNGTDSFVFKADDGFSSTLGTVNIAVGAINDAPLNLAPVGLSVEAGMDVPLTGLAIADVDAGGGALVTTLSVTHGAITIGSGGTAAISGNGTDSVTLTGTLAAINATLAADKNVIYRTDTGFAGTDSLTVSTSDNGNAGGGGALSDNDQVNLFWQHAAGSGADESYAALPGYARIAAGGGVDTVTFDFKLTDATISWVGNQVVVDTASSHTVLTGVEIYVFTDGTVNNNDADVLVDDLFYYAKNHDVWNAHVDADGHFHQLGRYEDRDPSAFFDTSFYLALNPDVRASGVDPLVHFGQSGWKEGRQPSAAFDTAAYLAANPDVAAAKIDPLAHFLACGAQEGRQPFALTSLIGANGFDSIYYLANNADVAATGVDPLAHFNTVGWREGRNPNAWFDTTGYLAHNPDVAAAGMNPLQHYAASGWQEGRDPSAGFDTLGYLAANPDVAAAHVNPLVHFLNHGIHEGRAAIDDGLWS